MNWDLSKLYSGFDAPEFAADMAALKDKTAAMAKQIATLAHGEGEAKARVAVI